MSIDKRGKWWTGSEFNDIAEYLRGIEPGGYAVDRVVEARCSCGRSSFFLNLDAEEELAQTVCAFCGIGTFVADSEDHWSEAQPSPAVCPCGGRMFQVGLGLCIRNGEWVRWGSPGTRCESCGILGSPLDWKSDLELSDPAATRVAAGDGTGAA
jgi:hypothetical protein